MHHSFQDFRRQSSPYSENEVTNLKNTHLGVFEKTISERWCFVLVLSVQYVCVSDWIVTGPVTREL